MIRYRLIRRRFSGKGERTGDGVTAGNSRIEERGERRERVEFMETEAETGGSRREDQSAGKGKDGRRDGESVALTTTLKQPSGDCSIYGCFIIHCLVLFVCYHPPASLLRRILTLV